METLGSERNRNRAAPNRKKETLRADSMTDTARAGEEAGLDHCTPRPRSRLLLAVELLSCLVNIGYIGPCPRDERFDGAPQRAPQFGQFIVHARRDGGKDRPG